MTAVSERVSTLREDENTAAQDIASLHLKDFLSYRLSRLARVLDRNTEVVLAKDYDLSLTESRVLGYLAVSSPTTVRELADEMCLDKGQVSRAANALVKSGYAERRGDMADRRSAMFYISDAGNEHYRTHMTRARRGQGKLMAQLSAEELAVVNGAIDRLLEHVRDDD